MSDLRKHILSIEVIDNSTRHWQVIKGLGTGWSLLMDGCHWWVARWQDDQFSRVSVQRSFLRCPPTSQEISSIAWYVRQIDICLFGVRHLLPEGPTPTLQELYFEELQWQSMVTVAISQISIHSFHTCCVLNLFPSTFCPWRVYTFSTLLCYFSGVMTERNICLNQRLGYRWNWKQNLTCLKTMTPEWGREK